MPTQSTPNSTPSYEEIAVFLVAVVVSLEQYVSHGLEIFQWDVMLISGLIALLFGIHAARNTPHWMSQTLHRLVNRGTLKASPGQLVHFEAQLGRRATVWAHCIAVAVAGAMLAAHLKAFWGEYSVARVGLTAFEVVASYIAGLHLGRMACYGQSGRLLKRAAMPVTAVPGHLDGAAGLKPVGDFYFRQAMITFIPATYLAVWWLIIPLWPDPDRYENWRQPYLGLLVVAITLQIFAFIVPMHSYHREMKKQKAEYLEEADKLSSRICLVEARLANDDRTGEAADALREQLAEMTRRYWAIERMPTWPVDLKTRRRFSLNNVALLAPPLLSKLLAAFGIEGGLARVIDALAR